MKHYDVIVIGGGLLGCFAARNLARYDLKVALLEKREDLCTGISKANTAIIYSGCDTKPGTMKASMCVCASQGFAELCEELGARYSPCGSLMVCFGERGAGVLRKKLKDGIENGVRGMRLLSREETLELEPNLAENVHSGLYVPDTGTVMPWELCLAAAENAAENGVEFFLNTEVTDIGCNGQATIVSGRPEDGACPTPYAMGEGERRRDGTESERGFAAATEPGYLISTNNGAFSARAIVNCAGLDADRLLEMRFEPVVRIAPTAGDYLVLDTKAAGFISHVIFHEPEEKGKGLTLVPTVDGNILLGPTERDFADSNRQRAMDSGRRTKEKGLSGDGLATREYGYETEHEGMELLRSLAAEIVPMLSLDHVIRSFGAVRPNPFLTRCDNNGEWVLDDRSVSDFCVVESGKPGSGAGLFISLIGVKTPGLTCANELGKHVADKIAANLNSGALNPGFQPRRLSSARLSDLSFDERAAQVGINPDCADIVCRCRGVSKGEIECAIQRFPGAVARDGVRRRTGAGSGRCQGSFCGQRVTELIDEARGETRGRFEARGRSEARGRFSCSGLSEQENRPLASDRPLASNRPLASPLASGQENRPLVRPLVLYDVVVVGGGPSGMAAALGAAKSGEIRDGESYSADKSVGSSKTKVLIIERDTKLGGILNQCTHKGFGLTYFGEELTGQEYAKRFVDRVESSEIEVLTSTMVLDISDGGILTISGKKTGLARIRAKAVVLASGCRERPIGSLPVAGTRPDGIYAAGAAQKMINLGGYDLGDRFVILGSGDVGMIVARELATRGKEVVAVLEKEGKCGGLERNRVNCLEKYGIPLITRSTVSKVHGIGRISGITLSHNGLPAPDYIECDTLITSVGLIPERELLDRFGEALPDWLFLCGNACFIHDVVDDVTEESERSGRFAAEYAKSGELSVDSGELGTEHGELRSYVSYSASDRNPVQASENLSISTQNLATLHTPHKAEGCEAARQPALICTACPKGCSVWQTEDGWQGLLCGRGAPG